MRYRKGCATIVIVLAVVVSGIALGLVSRSFTNVPLGSGVVETLIPFLVIVAGGTFIGLMATEMINTIRDER